MPVALIVASRYDLSLATLTDMASSDHLCQDDLRLISRTGKRVRRCHLQFVTFGGREAS